MAVTELVPYAAGNVAAMRLVTSLTLVDRQWWNTVTAATGVGVLVLVFTIWSGLFFVRSIVRPLGEIEATATKIAKGDLQVRLPDNRYNDEVGRLCKTINQMAEDLAETERLKNEFISSVSHELRTPLTSIKGWVETIGNIDDPTDKNYQRGLSVIGTETDRLYTMVEELLETESFDELVRAMAGMKFKALSRKKADDVSETLKDQVKAERDACKKELQKLKEQFFEKDSAAIAEEIADCREPIGVLIDLTEQ